jgi:VanZ family protein
MFSRNNKTMISWAAVLLWMLLIFTFSAQPGKQSNNLSEKVSVTIIETDKQPAVKDSKNATVLMEDINHLVRKSAHFSAYLILGILVVNALRSSRIKGNKLFWISLIVCMLYSSSDELHQMFVPGRTALVTDVMIDSFGAVLGIGLYLFIRRIIAGKNKARVIG